MRERDAGYKDNTREEIDKRRNEVPKKRAGRNRPAYSARRKNSCGEIFDKGRRANEKWDDVVTRRVRLVRRWEVTGGCGRKNVAG